MPETDFAFGLDEKVLVGTQEGIVTGQATFSYRADEYLISLIDDDGLPFERWFPSNTVEKQRMH